MKSEMIHKEFVYGEKEHAFYEKNGYCPFDHFLTDEAVLYLRGKTDEAIARCREGFSTESITSSHQRKDRWLFELAKEPRILDMIERQVGPNVVLWATQILAKPPKVGEDTRWHQDAPYWPNVSGFSGSIWITLDDITENNGMLSVLAGWHKEDLPHTSDDGGFTQHSFFSEIDFSSLPSDILEKSKADYRFKAGQAGIHHPKIPHYAQRNESDNYRRVLILRYMAAEGDIAPRDYEDPETGEKFGRGFYLLRGEDVRGHGLESSPD